MKQGERVKRLEISERRRDQEQLKIDEQITDAQIYRYTEIQI
tara:strand:- start:644 stop:769 length:126 start_codon:yes stop_codon:yes gene_type:complete